ncbi:MAG: amidohydrolase [Clostridiales bacterium]|nr:amidohydrolase [Clostridiales bacterium]
MKRAGPTSPGDVVDAHVHLFTVRIIEEYVDAHPDGALRFRQVLDDRKFGRRGDTLPEIAPAEAARLYTARLDEAGIAKAIVVSIVPDSAYTREFIAAANGRFHALCNLDPRDKGAVALLEREMAAGFKGVKLLPVNRCFRLSDPACRPFFARAEELGAHIIVHYGVTVDPGGDLRFADPTDLSPVARDFPGLTFVVAHFGAGYFDHVLKVAYQCPNVCVDSSGTNNWIDYLPYKMTLAEVYERAIMALGPQRVLFGTDSNNIAPYRRWIAYSQLKIIEGMGLSEGDRDLIVRGNAVRIFRLDE